LDKKYYQHLKNELSENVEWIITDWILVGCWLLVGWFKWAFDSDPDHHHVGRVRFPPPTPRRPRLSPPLPAGFITRGFFGADACDDSDERVVSQGAPASLVRFREIQSGQNNKFMKKIVIWTRIYSGSKIILLIMIGRTRDRRVGLVPHLLTSGLILSLLVYLL
jgi:hypothetical protein